jgi:DNA-binding MarR family transcriptional regulator
MPSEVVLGRNAHAQALLEAWWSFGQVMRQHIMPKVIGQLDLDFKDFFALVAIHDGAIYPKLICSRLATNPSDISRILEKLEEKGLVTRALDPEDSRRIRVVLTAHGLATLEHKRRSMAEHILKAVHGMSADELERFASTMQHLTDGIKAQFKDEPNP